MMRSTATAIFFLAGLLCLPPPSLAQDDYGNRREDRRAQRADRPKRDAAFVLPSDVAAQERISVVLGRPTASAITASVVAKEAVEVYIEYGVKPGGYMHKTEICSLVPDQPAHLLLDKLAPSGRSYYRLRYRQPGEPGFMSGVEHAIQTQRLPGSSFVFEIQGDSHPERRHQFDPELYAGTLRGVASDRPDFYILMGDDFSVDTLHEVNAQSVTGRYRLQRPFLSLVGQSSPLFLVNGNHEQAAAANHDGTPNNVAVWAQHARDAFYPQPGPDGFYTGDEERVPHIGLLRDYYAWTWGDALFVVIDPYWHSTEAVDNHFGNGKKNREQSGRDLWAVTLGDAQYRWLRDTLAGSKARYKFVFSHHVLGTGRGGVEVAGLYEWGGRNRRGINEFAQRRPGWELPIHQLMVKHGVTIFFQGHDHLFARQELNGVIYQTLPEPADPSYALYFEDAYRSGDLRPNSGRLRVSISPEKVRIEYVRSRLPADVTLEHPDGEVAFSYEIPVRSDGRKSLAPRGR